MKVELINCTADALNLLLRSKNTRLAGQEDPADWSDERKQQELDYILGTIKSSWEFVDYVFRISGVTRAFTHQLVRTRTGSYAQEAMRAVDASHHVIQMPQSVADSPFKEGWEGCATLAQNAYEYMVKSDIPRQDARGILPTNVETSIMAKFNLRTLHEMAKLRLCTRTQGEYQGVMRAMRLAVTTVHPWTKPMLLVQCAATGTCAFPAYGKKECPIWEPALDQSAVMARCAEKAETMHYEADVKVVDGKAQ